MQVASNVRKLYHTLRHLSAVQIYYQLKYRLQRPRLLKSYSIDIIELEPLPFLPIPTSRKYVEISEEAIRVVFLNKSKIYKKSIQWDDMTHGSLWNYHLQYADFLKQDDLTVSEREYILMDLYEWLTSGKLKPEPYPASLRIMNLIRFLSEHKKRLKNESKLINYLYSELHFLENRLEYHLLGNHLMENTFALLMGGEYFQNDHWTVLAKKIFYRQIPDQILADGGHFERSPMYHLIILYRFIEAIHYLPKNSDLYSLFLETAGKMLGWIEKMSFRNDDLAHFNDSTDHQSYSKKQILQMAESCGITEYPTSSLKESGYKRIEDGSLELLIDACGIKPDSQPGHAHADSLSFILYFLGKPVIIDPGVSTYRAGERRQWERSTRAHNTVTYNGKNTADVWGKFRVARRPDVKILNESNSEIDIQLGYTFSSGEPFEHHRKFTCNQNKVKIIDEVNLTNPVEGRLHFHPSTNVQEQKKNIVILEDGIKIEFKNILQLRKFNYKCSKAFNITTKSLGISYTFEKNASITIILPST